MKLQNVAENNKLIAEFMGLKLDGKWYRSNEDLPINPITISYGKSVHEEQLCYHLSFDWLFSVLEKICRMKIGDGVEFVEYAYPRTFGMINEETGKIMVRLNGFPLFSADTLIEATWLAVVDFVKWRKENENINIY